MRSKGVEVGNPDSPGSKKGGTVEWGFKPTITSGGLTQIARDGSSDGGYAARDEIKR